MSSLKKFFNKGGLTALLVASSLTSTAAKSAGALDYISGCLLSMAGGMAGTAFANTRIESEQKISAAGYGIAGGLSCIVGMAYVGVTGSRAQFDAEYALKSENENLTFQLKRLSKERCLLNDTCKPGGRAIIVDTEMDIKKQGDKVFESVTSTIEAND